VQAAAVVPSQPDLLAAAHLCTELGRVDETRGALPLLREAARILDAIGLIVWVWDSQATQLTPALAHGYSPKVLAQLPKVRRDADNPTAAAFRSAQPSVVNGSHLANGALVVPLMTPAGCAGVLAIELPLGSTQSESVRALVTIFAAQLARVVGAPRATEAVDRKLA
jgi:GAF domain-containing protein